MITEDYVSFEIAKLLKEKGFGEECLGTYSTGDKELNISFECPYSNDLNDNMFVAAPTIQMVTKWLRVIYSIDISITPGRIKNYTALVITNKRLPFTSIGSFQTYEKACEEAIKYCLENLI